MRFGYLAVAFVYLLTLTIIPVNAQTAPAQATQLKESYRGLTNPKAVSGV